MNNDRVFINVNSINITSLESFANVNGRLSNNNKDVYFLCYFGCNDEQAYKCSIEAIENNFTNTSTIENANYVRVNHLNYIMNNDEISKYIQLYTNIINNQTLQEKDFSFRNNTIKNTVIYAFKEVLALFEKYNKSFSESIKQNFAVKLLFWFDKYAKILYKNKNDYSQSMKFVYFGDLKLQGFLFLYFLVKSGCDVCWLNPSVKCTLDDNVLNLASIKKEDNYINVQLAEFDPYKRYKKTKDNIAKSHSSNNACKNNASGNNAYTNNGNSSNNAYTNNNNIKTYTDYVNVNKSFSSNATNKNFQQGNITNNKYDTEVTLKGKDKKPLEYVELAKLAESIVMIYAFAGDGECFKTGSGVMIDERGYILTNYHVISDANYFLIRIEGEEKTYKSTKLIKYDNVHDLAILRIDRRCKAIPIYKGSSNLERGQKIVAIGSPMGLFNTVSDGIISGFRLIEDTPMIQFTAPVSSGSSGGALLDMYGNLVGINTCIIQSGENLNFAVEYRTIFSFVCDVITT